MKKTLFKVHVDTYLIIEGPDTADGYDICWATRQVIKDHLANVENKDIYFEELESIKDLPEPWTPECLPYSTELYDTEDETISQILGDK